MDWLKSGRRRVYASALLAIPTSFLLLRPMFGPLPAGFLQALLTGAYSLGFWFGLLTFCWICLRSEPARPNSFAATAGREYWLIALAVSATLASLIVWSTTTFLNSQHAYWAKVTIVTDAPQVQSLSLRYGAAPQDSATVQWQPYNQTILALHRQNAAANIPVRVGQLELEGKVINPKELVILGGTHDGDTVFLEDPAGGMLRWPSTAARVSFLVSGGPETVTFFWLDQSRTVHLEQTPRVVNFELNARQQGWALLPPKRIDALRLVPGAGASGPFNVRMELMGQSALPLDLGTMHFDPADKSGPPWSLPAPINVPRPARLATAWISICGTGMLAIWLMYRCNRQRIFRPEQLIREDGFARAVIPVWMVCAPFQLVFALTLPIAYTPDSVGYYGMGKLLLASPYLQSVEIARTPGYPLFLSFVIALFGNTVVPIAVLQHLALASLSAVAMWCLWDKLPRNWVCVAGLMAGIAPVVAITGNVLWTESLFCVFSTSALLLASCHRRSLSYLFMAGACGGVATMLRPNGLLAVVVTLVYLVTRYLWLRGAVSVRTLVASAGGLVGGYLMIAAPWHLHLAVNRGTVAVGESLREFAHWQGYVFQDCLPIDLPINAPNRSIFAYPGAYDENPYTALASFPLIMGSDPAGYYRETRSEWLTSQPWTPYWRTLQYHATLGGIRPEPHLVIDQIHDLLDLWSNAPGSATAQAAPPSEIESLLIRLTSPPPPVQSRTAQFHLALGRFVLAQWRWLALLALGGASLVSVAKPWSIPLIGYGTATILAYSTNLVPTERYIIVLEPLFYIQAVAFLHTLSGAVRKERTEREGGVYRKIRSKLMRLARI